jgi:2-methylcitrate dehydratase PrpD
LSQYNEGVVLSKPIQTLLSKVEIEEDSELTSLLPDIRGAKVEVRTAEKKYQCRIDYSLGEPENPMDDNAIIGKFISLAEFVGIKKEIADQIVSDVYKGNIITKFD